MPRVVGIDLPKQKRIEVALTYIYGIGQKSAGDVLKGAGINPATRTKDLTEEEAAKISAVIQKGYKVEGDLRLDVAQNIKRLMTIGCWRGFRHRRGLPVRGQRTHTNARTRKGPGKTVGVKRST
ncbi:MAG: 30S ribosomal protein S13 [Candidatus Aureabacteria bacterium]|nr:30S ribosomal protein S13 [Candidatus Auribacterota bacterium]